MELDADWEEGLPWMLLAIREVTQKSIDFSPNELVFGHVVRGPTDVLADKWHTSKPPDIIDYVCGFLRRLYEARAIAKKKLVQSQVKMQRLFDRKAKSRTFHVGDRVLALLSLPINPFQANVAVVLLRCVILLLIKDFPHKSGCAKGDLIAAPSLSPFCVVKHTNRQALLSVRLSLLPLLSNGIAGKRTHTHYI